MKLEKRPELGVYEAQFSRSSFQSSNIKPNESKTKHKGVQGHNT